MTFKDFCSSNLAYDDKQKDLLEKLRPKEGKSFIPTQEIPRILDIFIIAMIIGKIHLRRREKLSKRVPNIAAKTAKNDDTINLTAKAILFDDVDGVLRDLVNIKHPRTIIEEYAENGFKILQHRLIESSSDPLVALEKLVHTVSGKDEPLIKIAEDFHQEVLNILEE